MTDLTIGKFADHLPFYRQIALFYRLGIELKQATIEGWFFGIADLMRPMYYRLQEYMRLRRIRTLTLHPSYIGCNMLYINDLNK